MLEIEQLQKILPQAFPFLFIDRVLDYEAGKYLTALKNVTADEWMLSAGETAARLPEVLLIEAAAQAALVLYHVSFVKEGDPQPQYRLGRVKAQYDAPVFCGDVLILQARAVKLIKNGGVAEVEIFAHDEHKAQVALVLGVV